MEGARWWESGVFYHVYLRSFQDSNGDGVGDLAGLTRRLPYLRWLGVDALWVSPFYASPMRDYGYDVADHTAVDPLFGLLAHFDALLEKAHALGLRVVVDWIPNHTSSQHPWFRAARDPRSPYRDFYYWRPGEAPPNNWPAAFGGPAWTRDRRSDAWFLHLCLPEMPDLNWHHPGVEREMFDVARFWLDRGVDGFRVDVAHWIGKNAALPDNPPADAPAFVNLAKPATPFDQVAHVHDMDGPLAHAVYKRFRQLLDQYQPPRVALGEIHLGSGARWAAYYGQDDELHLPCFFGLLSVPFEAAPLADAIRAQESVLPPGAWPTYVLGNHDEPRLASRVGPSRARAAALLLLTLRGTPTLYYGDELGLENLALAPGQQRDPLGLRVPGLGRDAGRGPMPWTDARHAGFCPPGAVPWLPVPDGYRALAVAKQRRDSASLLHLYRRLLRLRKRHPALVRGALAGLEGVGGVLRYTRVWQGETLEVVLNLSARAVPLPPGAVLLRTDGAGPLAPDAGAVVQR